MDKQIERFKKGFPSLMVEAPAKVGSGIERLGADEQEECIRYLSESSAKGKCKFVPASGAASRMFKDIFAGMDEPNAATEKLASELEKFAFYSPEVFGKAPYDPCGTARKLLESDGLGYGSKPKGVLKFHRYGDEVRTAIAEHFVEGQAYMRDDRGNVKLCVTVSPEHLKLFESEVHAIKEKYEKKYGVKYEVEFTFQDKETDTIAVNPDNTPFLLEDGSVLKRPAGHGALIYNLNRLDAELVSIKNIDNVCSEKFQEETVRWQKILMGRALQLRDRIHGYLYALDQLTELIDKMTSTVYMPIPAYNLPQADPYSTEECQELCNEIESFLKEELYITLPKAHDCRERAAALRSKLDRPIRVCGMVRNEGEPGGGPFVVRDKDGSTSLQILEGAQINPEDPKAVKALSEATHFNPVEIVCCLLDYKGNRYNLPDFVDPETGLISRKSYKGRELKALELPGLWNGSMSNWNTLFIEVPIGTFNPVKTVLDLLRESHQ